jgi:hypothetical protein
MTSERGRQGTVCATIWTTGWSCAVVHVFMWRIEFISCHQDHFWHYGDDIINPNSVPLFCSAFVISLVHPAQMKNIKYVNLISTKKGPNIVLSLSTSYWWICQTFSLVVYLVNNILKYSKKCSITIVQETISAKIWMSVYVLAMKLYFTC